MIKMRPSRVLRKLRSGEVAVSAFVNLTDPRVTEIAALAGFDCVWIDTEHQPNTIHDIQNHVRAGKMYDVDIVVRVERGSYSDLIRPLEVDATGIMVPHLMSADDARQIAHFTRFHPVGRRPLDGGNSDGAFTQIPVGDYIRQANEERFVIVQIEDPEPLEEIEEIAAVEGIDMLFFGPGDFTHGIGVPHQFDDPRVEEARSLIVKAAMRHGKFAGTVSTPDRFPKLVEMGYRFLNVGADVIGVFEYFKKIRSSIGP